MKKRGRPTVGERDPEKPKILDHYKEIKVDGGKLKDDFIDILNTEYRAGWEYLKTLNIGGNEYKMIFKRKI